MLLFCFFSSFLLLLLCFFYFPGNDVDPVLHKSLLHCFMRDKRGRPLRDVLAGPENIGPLMQMLDENFRMSANLSDFTRCIYGAR
jgi:hypothetical protein